jgi:hypothetical protein
VGDLTSSLEFLVSKLVWRKTAIDEDLLARGHPQQ